MKPIDQLKIAEGLKDVARTIGFKPKSLSYLIYVLPPASRYTQFSIPKVAGGTREIMAPCPQLKLVQSRLAHLLQNYLREIEKSHVIKSNHIVSHGFKRDLSIATNAEIHVGRRWVLNIDLENFFPSINFGRVRDLPREVGPPLKLEIGGYDRPVVATGAKRRSAEQGEAR